MKNIVLIFLTIITSSCSTYSQKKNDSCKIIQNVTTEKEPIDTSKYKLSPHTLILKDNESEYIEILQDNKIRYWEENKIEGLVKYKTYYLSGKIMSYEIFYKKQHLGIGKEYIFDESGEIVKIIDNDDPEHYSICYKDAMTIALKNAGKKYEITNISRGNDLVLGTRSYFWEVIATKIGTIHYYSDSKRYYINGKTGKIIKITKLQISSSDVLTPQKE